MPDSSGQAVVVNALGLHVRAAAQFVRLAWDARAGRVLEQPSIVAQRYGGSSGPGR